MVTPDGNIWLLKGNPTALYNPGTDSLSAGPALPAALDGVDEHCVVKYDADNLLLIGGEDGGDDMPSYASTWHYSFSTGQWTERMSLPFGREAVACAAIRHPENGLEVISVGGWIRNPTANVERTRDVQIFNVASGRWREANKFPIHRDEGALVQFGDTVLSVGGDDEDNDAIDFIFQYDVENDEWFLRKEEISDDEEDCKAVYFPEAASLCSPPEK